MSRPMLRLVPVCALMLVSACSESGRTEREGHALPPAAASELRRAVGLAREGELEGALAAAQNARRMAPRSPEAHRTIGQIHLAARTLDSARAALTTASNLHPEHAPTWELLGHVAYQDRSFRDAIAFYRRAVALEPSAFAWQGIGGAYRELYMPDSAEAAYLQATAADSAFAPAWAAIAEVRADEGRFREALTAAERALLLNPRDAAYQYLRARLMLRLDDAGGAIPILEDLIRRDSTQHEPLYTLGLAYRQVGQDSLGELALQRAAALRAQQRERRSL